MANCVTSDLNSLNEIFKDLELSDRFNFIFSNFQKSEILITSSFATTSAMLLREVSMASPGQDIHFIDTNYHFEETIGYKNLINQAYDLNVIDVKPREIDYFTTLQNELWKTDPNLCCQVNKVEPLTRIKNKFNVWISGLMHWQNERRSHLNFFELRNDILKCYPLLDVTYEDRISYFEIHNLIPHPLVKQGYSSIGCKHCTIPSESRGGRWNNNPKTECGLHL